MLVKVVARADRKKNEEIELCLNGKREKQMIVFDVCRMVYEAYICDKKDRYKRSIPHCFPEFNDKIQCYRETKEGQKRHVLNHFLFLLELLL